MKFKGILLLALPILILSLPLSSAAASASATAARMVTKGNAEINGVTAPAVTSIFVGDRIATNKNTTTSLNLANGDSIVLPELSKAVLIERDGHLVVNLEEGTVAIQNKAKLPIVVEMRGARIAPAGSQPAAFQVTLHGNALRVVTSSGAAHVETANHAGDVKAGTGLDASFAPGTPQASNGFLALSTTSWIIIGGLAATGLGVGVYEATKSSVSPH